ncbi:MAG: MMPL family transporter [Clostridia bacterium]|nr:MMPL family transporter [Clostridia bacterium]
MKKIASAIVRFRYLLSALMLLLCVPAALNIGGTGINYDLTAYLAPDTMTARGLKIMEAEFENTASLSLVLVGGGDEEAFSFAEKISNMEGVISASYDPATGLKEKDGEEWRLIGVISDAASAEKVYDGVEALLKDTPHMISGAVRDGRIIRKSMSDEIPLVMLISCLIVLLVLLLMSRSPVEPVMFFMCIGVSIVLNMGTNNMFGSISFITFAVAAILQLALAMDYSIMLINAYDRMLESGLDRPEAMAAALEMSFLPVSSSALTTVAGMLSLVFMSFTIGFDIGMVLAKGIVISMLTVFLMLPGFLTLFTPLMLRTAHRPLHLSGKRLSALIQKSRGTIAAALILLIVAGAALQTRNAYTYTVRDMDGESAGISEAFGRSDPVALLIPLCRTDGDYDEESAALREIGELEIGGRKAVTSVYAMPVTGEAALKTVDADTAADMMGMDRGLMRTFFALLGIDRPIRGGELVKKAEAFLQTPGGWLVPADTRKQITELSEILSLAEGTFNGREWSRAILFLDMSYMDPGAREVLDGIREIMTAHYGDRWAMTGGIMATDDIGTSFSGDLRRVGLITVAAVFLIILLSFKNAAVPVTLVCVIQGAVWVNMAYSGLKDGSVFFMCYLICMALQMGATIDYGILLTENYRRCRASTAPWDAAAAALDRSMQTVLTSGLALVTAGFAVGKISSVFYISSIGTMLGRGAVVSVLLVLLLLPQMLVWLDRLIIRGQNAINAAGKQGPADRKSADAKNAMT